VSKLAKKSQKRNFRKKIKKVLAIDLGGTKILAAAIDESGRIFDEIKEPVDFSNGVASLIAQIKRLCLPIIKKHAIKKGALASAGPLDPTTGELLNATNFKSAGKSWGRVKIINEIQKKLHIKMSLENDAAAAVLAEHGFGRMRACKNLLVITLGTGLGVGVIANGQLVRSGRNLHPEAGHIVLDHADKQWLCGCGNYGCAEASLSGANFTRNLGQIWHEPHLTGEDLVARAQQNDDKALRVFVEYGSRLAAFMYSMCVLFTPEHIIISGGFSHSYELFLPTTKLRLASLLGTRRVGVDMLPTISISKHQDRAGLLGAAWVAYNRS
jgi:glucokinase